MEMKIQLLIAMGLNVVLLVLLYLQGNLTRQAINAGKNGLNLLRETMEKLELYESKQQN